MSERTNDYPETAGDDDNWVDVGDKYLLPVNSKQRRRKVPEVAVSPLLAVTCEAKV